jgi:hypothetical protein
MKLESSRQQSYPMQTDERDEADSRFSQFCERA